jgi:hypothetical protein
MVEAGDHWLGDDPAKPLDGAANRCIRPERQMRAGLIVQGGEITPIRLTNAKFSIHGIRGLGVLFMSMR